MLSLPPLSASAAAGVHALLEYAAIALGAWLYRRALRQPAAGDGAALLSDATPAWGRGWGSVGRRAQGLLAPGRFVVLVGLLLGAAIGNKAVFFIERPDIWRAFIDGAGVWPGQSLVGGLLGGLIGVELAKAASGQTRSTGDALLAPLCAGIALGRVGCFLAGLHDDTYGLPTTLPWGVNLGDGVPRHPSPLYEIGFVALLYAVLRAQRARLAVVPGLAFKLFLSAYLLWRLGGDFLKPVRVPYPLGLSGIQWVCALALAAYAPLVVRAGRQAARALRQRPPPADDPHGWETHAS